MSAFLLSLAVVGLAASPAALYAAAYLGAHINAFWPIVLVPAGWIALCGLALHAAERSL